jgi:hypothetical protein
VKTITAENMWSKEIILLGFFSYSISGEFSATISLQRSFDSGITWETILQETEPTSDVFFEPYPPFTYTNPTTRYRIGVNFGDYVSGTIVVSLDAKDYKLNGISYSNSIVTEDNILLLTEDNIDILVE